MRWMIIFFCVGVLIGGCKEKSKNKEVDEELTINITKAETEEDVEKLDPCVRCDSIFYSFPTDSLEFEILYGYHNGSRQAEVQEDMKIYFYCLSKCFDLEEFKGVLKLGTSIKFDADGPTFLRYYLTDYLMRHKEKALMFYNKAECIEFADHVTLLYARVKNTNFTDSLCNFLSSFELGEDCKIEVIKEHCERDFFEYFR